MKHPVRRLAALLLGLTLWTVPAAAVETQAASEDLTALMDDFRAEYGLNEGNFSLCYYNTVTGEEYRYNDTKFMIAASTYKLPLNMHYYEMEAAGEISSAAMIGATTLADAHYQSLVWSNNDVSIDMLYNLGNFRTYKNTMKQYFTMPEEEIDSIYYADNYYCTSMMLDTLKHLYEGGDKFDEMIGYMKQAQPGEYFKMYVTDYEIAHKYGYYVDDGVTAINDTGIIYTPQPFLLVVYTSDAPGGAEVLGRAAEVLTEYTVTQDVPEPEPEESSTVTEQPEEQPETAEPTETTDNAEPEPTQPEEPPVEEPKEETPEETEPQQEKSAGGLPFSPWWLALGGAAVFLVADVVVIIRILRRR